MEVQIKDNKTYAPLKDKWLVVKPEEEVRQRYICRLVDSYAKGTYADWWIAMAMT